jgi:hypothetical protein
LNSQCINANIRDFHFADVKIELCRRSLETKTVKI